jgi:hypothetical protein
MTKIIEWTQDSKNKGQEILLLVKIVEVVELLLCLRLLLLL